VSLDIELNIVNICRFLNFFLRPTSNVFLYLLEVGLEFYNNNFITHNDSGGEPSLYLFNEEGEIIETIGLDKNPDFKIENNDWEE
jgi:hypothetical protein